MLRTVGISPPGDEATPMVVRQHAYQGTARPNPDRTLVALGNRHADRLEVYRPDGTLVAQATGPLGFTPVYKTAVRAGSPAMTTGEDLRFGYVDLATTRDRIYALYSGRARKEHPGRANYGNYLHVYDWGGRLQEVLKLDQEVFQIEVDAKGEQLYAVRVDPTPAILAYRLPPDKTGTAR
jgi:hypothetical protein